LSPAGGSDRKNPGPTAARADRRAGGRRQRRYARLIRVEQLENMKAREEADDHRKSKEIIEDDAFSSPCVTMWRTFP
jgi:hypothetical protein